jgi:hypothetical protein
MDSLACAMDVEAQSADENEAAEDGAEVTCEEVAMQVCDGCSARRRLSRARSPGVGSKLSPREVHGTRTCVFGMTPQTSLKRSHNRRARYMVCRMRLSV